MTFTMSKQLTNAAKGKKGLCWLTVQEIWSVLAQEENIVTATACPMAAGAVEWLVRVVAIRKGLEGRCS